MLKKLEEIFFNLHPGACIRESRRLDYAQKNFKKILEPDPDDCIVCPVDWIKQRVFEA